jgi:hypothetical protein
MNTFNFKPNIMTCLLLKRMAYFSQISILITNYIISSTTAQSRQITSVICEGEVISHTRNQTQDECLHLKQPRGELWLTGLPDFAQFLKNKSFFVVIIIIFFFSSFVILLPLLCLLRLLLLLLHNSSKFFFFVGIICREKHKRHYPHVLYHHQTETVRRDA